MKRWFLASAAGLLLIVTPSFAQKKAAGVPAPKKAPSVEDLVLDGKFKDAVRLAAKTTGGARDALEHLFAKADLDISKRQLEEAGRTLTAAEKFANEWTAAKKGKDLPLDALEGRKLRLQGIKLSDSKEYDKAEEVLRRALVLSKDSKDRALEGGVHNNLGYALRYQKKLEASSSEFDTARQIAESQKDDLRAASYNLNLGDVLLQLDRTSFAVEAFRRAADQSRAAGKPNLEARALLMQGVAQVNIVSSAPDPALRQAPLRLMAQAEKMFEEQGDDRNTGWALYLMADRVAYTMKFRDAAALGERALPYFTQAKDKAGLKACYGFLTDMYNKLNDKAKSEKYRKLAAGIDK